LRAGERRAHDANDGNGGSGDVMHTSSILAPYQIAAAGDILKISPAFDPAGAPRQPS